MILSRSVCKFQCRDCVSDISRDLMLAFLPRYKPYSFGLVAYQIGFCCITLNKSESDQNDRHRAARCRCTPSLPGYLLARQMTLTATRWICTELSRRFPCVQLCRCPSLCASSSIGPADEPWRTKCKISPEEKAIRWTWSHALTSSDRPLQMSLHRASESWLP